MHASRKVELIFFCVLAALTALLTFFILKPFLSPLFLAMVFTIVFKPFYDFLLRRMGGKAAVSALLTVLALVLIIVVPVFLCGFFIFRDAQAFYQSISGGWQSGGVLQAAVEPIQNFVRHYIPGFSFDFIGYLKQGLSLLIQNFGALFGKIFTAVLQVFLMLLGVFYFLRDGKKFREHLIFLSPLSDTHDRNILAKFELAVHSVVTGALSIAVIQGVLSVAGFVIFGLPNPTLWGAVTAIAALIPGVGTALVIVPAILYLFFFGSTFSAVGLLIWGSVAVGVVDNVLGPLLMRRRLNIHPFLVLLSVLGGLSLFGPVGFLAGPITLALFFALIDIYPLLLERKDAGS